MTENKIYIDGIEYDLNTFKPTKASVTEILIATKCNEESEAESEADSGYYYVVYWKNNTIYIDFVQENESIESILGNTNYKETDTYIQHLFIIKNINAIDFINEIITYDLYEYEYVKNFGERRVNMLHFIINTDTEQEIAKMGDEKLVKTFLRTLMKYRR